MEIIFSIKKKVKKGSGSKTLPSSNSPSRAIESPTMGRRLPADPSEAIGTAVVKYNYQAQQADELSLVKGTRILILEKSNDGWWRGQSGSVAGWFPSNYTQEEGDNDDTLHTYAMAENVLDIVVALYSFVSNNEQELAFEKGDRLEILDRPPSDPEWYKARNAQGQIGLVPRNYLQVSNCAVFNLMFKILRNLNFQILQELSEYLTQPYRNRDGGSERHDSLDRRNEGNIPGVRGVDRPHLIGKPWYYGTITRAHCDNLLNQHGHDGDFLIRDSETNVSMQIL